MIMTWFTNNSDGFLSVTRTPDELSIVCSEKAYKAFAKAHGAAFAAKEQQGGWLALKVKGPLAFELVGILANISGTLALADVSIFALSTYNTDYVLVQADKADAALAALNARSDRFSVTRQSDAKSSGNNNKKK